MLLTFRNKVDSDTWATDTRKEANGQKFIIYLLCVIFFSKVKFFIIEVTPSNYKRTQVDISPKKVC
jgi:hypothetical protein